MLYKIIENFGPEDGDRWISYLEWRGLNLTRFDSVDGNLRPDLFMPESDEDWKNCINEDNKLSLISNLEYAQKLSERFENSVIVGVEIELQEGHNSTAGLLGYDIIDGYSDVSLLTNWGNSDHEINNSIIPNGLINDLDLAFKIRNRLRQEFPDDPHANACEVWAVYDFIRN